MRHLEGRPARLCQDSHRELRWHRRRQDQGEDFSLKKEFLVDMMHFPDLSTLTASQQHHNISTSLNSHIAGGQPCQLDLQLACRRRHLRRGDHHCHHHHHHRHHHHHHPRQVLTIVTEITTAVAANPENSTVSTINFFLQVLNENIFLQITTLTSKITSISSSLVCSDDEKTSLMTSVGFMTLIDLLMTDTQFDHAT